MLSISQWSSPLPFTDFLLPILRWVDMGTHVFSFLNISLIFYRLTANRCTFDKFLPLINFTFGKFSSPHFYTGLIWESRIPYDNTWPLDWQASVLATELLQQPQHLNVNLQLEHFITMHTQKNTMKNEWGRLWRTTWNMSIDQRYIIRLEKWYVDWQGFWVCYQIREMICRLTRFFFSACYQEK